MTQETAAAQETSFVTVLDELAASDPDRPALTVADETLTRAQLVGGIHAVAHRLVREGVGPGSTVTIGLPNSVEFVLAMFAVWHVGATPQPVSNRLPAHERRAILALAEPAVAVGIEAADAEGVPVLSATDVRTAADVAVEPLEPTIAPVWKIVTSGGSTGRPKLILACQPAAFENLAPFATLLRFPRDGAVLVTGPMSHNAPFIVCTAGLLYGNHVVVVPRFDAAATLELVEEHRVNWLYLVPTMMQRIWRLPDDVRLGADLSSIEVAFHMAAPCPRWLKHAWIGWLGADRVLELYGGTELQAMTIVTGREWLDHEGSVGRPVIGEIEVRNDEGRPVAPGVVGELWMRRGDGVASPYQYIGAKPRAADAGWESLGDMGCIDEDGYVYLADRNSDMILVGGANVYPAEVEAALDEHPAVRSSCVIGLPHEDLGSVPHALVEVAAGHDVADDDLLAHLRDRLAPYKLPRTFERVTEPLRDDAGKVRRSALRAERVAAGGPASEGAA